MKEVSVFDAKNRLSALLDEVEGGREVTITRRGKPVAKLVQISGQDRARQAAEGLLALRVEIAASGERFSREEIKSFIEDGRR